ncbi:hypothetical protein GURASL_23060 [Geotalea uraniireducens]|uniref:YbbR-like domain-containing protein n=1 Tax=Geotalea uraniireducens TaxID=351604 RepID=A0ABM8ELR8_9BACT|nr:hypothetical protein [Geotalea uraniireducens]BDV43383.1 hypothetical protein GURASL_23060 [Geotalea uraniireducens]
MVDLIRSMARNWGIKVLALLFAVALWLAVAGERKGRLELTIPVTVRNAPTDCAVIVDHPVLAVSLVGPRILLLKLRGENIIMPLDMKGVGAGTTSFSNLAQQLVLPDGVVVSRVFPADVSVTVKRKFP